MSTSSLLKLGGVFRIRHGGSQLEEEVESGLMPVVGVSAVQEPCLCARW